MRFRTAAVCLPALLAALLAAFLASFAVALCFAQDSAFRAEVHLVSVGFSIRDASGHLVPNLPQEDFEVFEDGVQQKISYF